MKKRLLILGTTAAVGLASVTSLGLASATTNSNGADSLASKIAQKFNLKEADVTQVINDHRAERQADRQQKMSEHLQAKVADGTITADQKTKLEAELKALDAKRDTIRQDTSLSDSDRRTKMEALHTELDQWAKDNGIDLSKVMPMMGKGMGMSKGMGGHHMNGDSSDAHIE